MEEGSVQTLHSICERCRSAITISIVVGEQRWDQVEWHHVLTDPNPHPHVAVPELRFAIDATCPGCKHPEIGYSPEREQFVCSRCQWTGSERPAA